MSEPRRGSARALDSLASLAMGLAGFALVAMALIQAWQVFARYVLNDSPGWTEPLALLLMSFGNSMSLIARPPLDGAPSPLATMEKKRSLQGGGGARPDIGPASRSPSRSHTFCPS